MREAFNGHTLTVVEYDGQPVMVARELAAALGYSDPSRLGDLIRNEWAADFTEGEDFRALRGEPLAEFKRLTPPDGVSLVDPRSPSLLILTESGWWMVAQRTEKALGVKLRRFLSREVLPRLARGESIPAAASGAAVESQADRYERLGDKAAGIGDKASARKFYRAAGEALGLSFSRAPRALAAPDQQVPLLTLAKTAEQEWDAFVRVWREQYGTERTTAAKLYPLARGAGLFRARLDGRAEPAGIIALGRIISPHIGDSVKMERSTRNYLRLVA